MAPKTLNINIVYGVFDAKSAQKILTPLIIFLKIYYFLKTIIKHVYLKKLFFFVTLKTLKYLSLIRPSFFVLHFIFFMY